MGFHPLVDHKRKFVLFWNAKCGCSSLKDLFLRVVRGDDASGFQGDVRALYGEVGYASGQFACSREDVLGPFADYHK